MHSLQAATGILLLLFVLLPFTHAIQGLYSQTMTWNILSNRSHTITYGGSCSESSFYFNEIDANYDPDNDGNAARIAPSAGARTLGLTTTRRDYNFDGVTNPSSGNVAYQGETALNPPTSSSTITAEFTDDEYIAISFLDSSGHMTFSNPNHPTIKATFKSIPLPEKVTALTFRFAGVNIHNSACDTETSEPITAGIDRDINFFLWNYTDGAYVRIGTIDGAESFGVHPVAEYDRNFAVDYNLTRFINAADKNITLLVQGDKNSSTFSCLYSDALELYQQYYYDNNIFCQSSTIAPFTITNNGNTDLNIDGNFSNAFTGADINLVLKVWQGTGSGCGTNGFGGWEKDCSITNALTDLGMTTCRQYNQTNATTRARLVTQLSPNDSNQLCFSGDINTYVSGGGHAQTFGTTDINS